MFGVGGFLVWWGASPELWASRFLEVMGGLGVNIPPEGTPWCFKPGCQKMRTLVSAWSATQVGCGETPKYHPALASLSPEL